MTEKAIIFEQQLKLYQQKKQKILLTELFNF